MKLLFSLFLTLFSLQAAIAQPNPVKWSYEVEETKPSEYEVTFVASIDQGWAVYSQHLGDEGPIPTSFTFAENNALQLIGTPVESGDKKEGFDTIFEMNVIKYANTARFTQKVKSTAGQVLEGNFRYMTCNSKSCLPPVTVDFAINLSGE